jgi:hypothetical protein
MDSLPIRHDGNLPKSAGAVSASVIDRWEVVGQVLRPHFRAPPLVFRLKQLRSASSL